MHKPLAEAALEYISTDILASRLQFLGDSITRFKKGIVSLSRGVPAMLSVDAGLADIILVGAALDRALIHDSLCN